MIKSKFKELIPLLYASILWPVMFIIYDYTGIEDGYPVYFTSWLVAVASYFVVKSIIRWFLFDTVYTAPCHRISSVAVFRKFEHYTTDMMLASLGWLLLSVFAGIVTLVPGVFNLQEVFGGYFVLIGVLSVVFGVFGYFCITVAEDRANKFIKSLGVILPDEED